MKTKVSTDYEVDYDCSFQFFFREFLLPFNKKNKRNVVKCNTGDIKIIPLQIIWNAPANILV